MPDDRLFHPRLRLSQKVSALSDLEFRVWVDYVLVADNFGVLPCLAAMLKAGNSSLAARSEEQIQTALERVVLSGLLLEFTHQGQRYACDPLWQNYQKIRYPKGTYYPAPPAEIMSLMSEDTQDLFLRCHPEFTGVRKESDLARGLSELLPKIIREKITSIRREYRVGDYRLDFLVETREHRLVVEAKLRAITPATLDQVLRYREALSSDGTGDVLAIAIGTAIAPGLTAELIAARGVAAIVVSASAIEIVANPHTSIRLVAVKLPAGGGLFARPDYGEKPGRPDHRLTANGKRLEANGSERGSGGEADFDTFYRRYPKHVARGAAEKAWRTAITKDTPETILAGLERQLPELQKREEKYIPHPATWLNQERWKDEPGSPRSRVDEINLEAARAKEILRRGKTT